MAVELVDDMLHVTGDIMGIEDSDVIDNLRELYQLLKTLDNPNYVLDLDKYEIFEDELECGDRANFHNFLSSMFTPEFADVMVTGRYVVTNNADEDIDFDYCFFCLEK